MSNVPSVIVTVPCCILLLCQPEMLVPVVGVLLRDAWRLWIWRRVVEIKVEVIKPNDIDEKGNSAACGLEG